MFPIPKYPTKLPDHGQGLIHQHHLLTGPQMITATKQVNLDTGDIEFIGHFQLLFLEWLHVPLSETLNYTQLHL